LHDGAAVQIFYAFNQFVHIFVCQQTLKATIV